MTSPVVGVRTDLARSRVLGYGLSLVLLGWLDPTKNTDPAEEGFARDEVARLLDPRPVHDSDWLREVDEAFCELVAVLHRLDDFDKDPDGFLASIPRPQTGEMRDIVRGALVADKHHWLDRLEGLARP